MQTLNDSEKKWSTRDLSSYSSRAPRSGKVSPPSLRDFVFDRIGLENTDGGYEDLLVAQVLAAPGTPLYSLREFALLISDFIALLRLNQKEMTATGHPFFAFSRHFELDRLARTYYTRVPKNIHHQEDLFLNLFAEMLRGQFLAPPRFGSFVDPSRIYHWQVDREITYDWPNGGYRKAPLIDGLANDVAVRLEEGREKLLKLKVSILEILASTLPRQNSEYLWDECLKRLTTELSREEAAFLLSADRLYDQSYIAGGLTDIFSFIGYCEKEISVGTFARTRNALSGLIQKDLGKPQRLALDDYFATTVGSDIIQAAEYNILDSAVSLFSMLEIEERTFWKDYERKVNDALENEFRVEVDLPKVQLAKKYIKKFVPPVEAILKCLKEHLELTGDMPLVKLARIEIGSLSEGNIFRKEGQYWLINYEGKTCHLKDLKGVGYIACLLRYQGRELHVYELIEAVEGSHRDRKLMEDAVTNEGLTERMGLGGVGSHLDPQAKAEYKNRLRELEREIEQAEAFNDISRAAKLREEKDFLTKELADAFGQSRGDDSLKKAKKAVTRTINYALDKIQRTHPSLGRHLDRAITKGTFCSYSPEKHTSWDL